MATEPDFILYDRYGRRVAIGEVKAKRGTSSGWAAEFRRNLQAHEAFQYSPFFLIVTPDHLYLWTNTSRAERAGVEPVPPDYALDARPLLEPYVENSGLSLEKISRPAFELIVMSWLRDLVLQLPDVPWRDQLAQLEGSGLPEAAKDGRITYPAAA